MVVNAYSTVAAWRQCNPEMEFLDINLTKVSRLLIHAIHSLSTVGFLKSIRLYSGFKKTYKKSAKQENLSLFTNIILYKGKMEVENQKKTWVWEGSSLCQEMLFKNSISVGVTLLKDWLRCNNMCNVSGLRMSSRHMFLFVLTYVWGSRGQSLKMKKPSF